MDEEQDKPQKILGQANIQSLPTEKEKHLFQVEPLDAGASYVVGKRLRKSFLELFETSGAVSWCGMGKGGKGVGTHFCIG